MTTDATPTAPLFRYREAHADDTAGLGDALHEIYAGNLDVIIIREVYSREAMREVVARLEGGRAALPRTPQESHDVRKKQMFIHGDIITPSDTKPNGPPLERYLAMAKQYLDGVGALFEGFPAFHERLGQVFAGLAGGRRVATPVHPSGQSYTPTTIRELPPDCLIPLHVGNYFLGMPAYQFLATVIDTHDQLSFFMPMAVPDEGGQLTVYNLKFDDPAVPMNGPHVDEPRVVREVPSEMFHPGSGDLLIFDGGRFFHRVEKVLGEHTRWTIGGFVAFAKGQEPVVYYWS